MFLSLDHLLYLPVVLNAIHLKKLILQIHQNLVPGRVWYLPTSSMLHGVKPLLVLHHVTKIYQWLLLLYWQDAKCALHLQLLHVRILRALHLYAEDMCLLFHQLHHPVACQKADHCLYILIISNDYLVNPN